MMKLNCGIVFCNNKNSNNKNSNNKIFIITK